MGQNTARIGRRRRVLKEEVLSAGNAASFDESFAPGDTPRYGAGANIENHPQVTDLVPRKYRTVTLLLSLGLVIAIVAELAAHYSTELSALAPAISPEEITHVFANRLTAWTTSAVLLITAGYAKLVFSLRRFRVDDYRGRYRLWRVAVWTAVALSLNAVVGGHTLVARALGHFTEWSLLPGNAGWWLATAALAGGWLLLKLMFDAAECRGALVAYFVALCCFITAGVSAAGWSPIWSADWPDTMVRALPMAGYLFLLAGTLLFARYVVLDVQGLIEHRPVATVVSSESTESINETAACDTVKAAKLAESDDGWVAGSELEDEDHEQNTRRLSKAERKRLRKQKSRNRAA